jgi:beta-phosphoglucomutase-like phosphatase (HAD superfamily)
MDVDLAQRTHWIFDMDGTLTIAAIDFAALRHALDIPSTADIIGHIDALPPHQSAIQHRRLAELELDYAQQAQPQPGATELLEALRALAAT